MSTPLDTLLKAIGIEQDEVGLVERVTLTWSPNPNAMFGEGMGATFESHVDFAPRVLRAEGDRAYIRCMIRDHSTKDFIEAIREPETD